MASNTARVRAVGALVLLAALMSAWQNTDAAGDKKIGKWKLRVDPPAQGTREYEDRGDGVTLSTRQGVNAQGRAYFTQYAAKNDGKEYPRLVKGSQTVGTIAFTIVDADTVAFTLREDGKITSTGTTNVSKDGKVVTVTTKSLNGRTSVEVYDRVQ